MTKLILPPCLLLSPTDKLSKMHNIKYWVDVWFSMRYEFKLLFLVLFLAVSILHVPKVYPKFTVAYVKGTVYDAETGEPIEGVLVEYYIVFHSQNKHWGYPIESAITDANGYFEIELNEVEKQIGSETEYTLDQILSNGFLLIAYKEGYLRCYSAVNLFEPKYHYWSPEKNVKVLSLRMYKDFSLKSIKKGSLEAVYHFEYQKEAAEKLLYYTDFYLNILRDRLGVDLETQNILIKFDMGEKSYAAGRAHFTVQGPCEVIVNWYPWITDPINEDYYLLLVHELIHLFQPRLNNKGVPLWLSAGWIIEGQAVAVSKAIMHEMGKDGKSFQEQAVEPGVDYPQNYQDFIEIKGENYPKWGKMFSKIVVDYSGEDEWGFVRRFMQYLDEFVEKDAVAKDWDKPCPLSDYEVILVLSFAACQNLTDLFVQVFNYPAQKLSQQRLAYLKYYTAKSYLNNVPADKQSEFMQYFNEGIEKFINREYEDAEKEFDKALELANWNGVLHDPIFAKCFVEKVEIIINLKTVFPENLYKYIIYLDGKPVKAGEPVEVPKGTHKIEVYYNRAKIYEEYFEAETHVQRQVEIKEYKLKLLLPGSGPWKVTFLRGGATAEVIETNEKTLVLPLPEGDYKIVIESGREKWSKSISLGKDTVLDFEARRSIYLTITVGDQTGTPLKATVFIDGKKFEIEGRERLKLATGEYMLKVYWMGICVTRKTVEVRESGAEEDIIIEFAKLKVKAPSGCTVDVYWNNTPLFTETVGATGEVEFKLPKQKYEVQVNCQGEIANYPISLHEDTTIEHVKKEYSILWIFEIAAVAAVLFILLLLFLLKKRLS